jgi:hypothetical protein
MKIDEEYFQRKNHYWDNVVQLKQSSMHKRSLETRNITFCDKTL